MSTTQKVKKKIPSHIRIFIALGLGVAFGIVLNQMGGQDHPTIKNYIIPFLQFLGDMFIRLIRMSVVPLVFFSIMDAVMSLTDLKKLRFVGITTLIWFLATGLIAAGIGLVVVNVIKPGAGFHIDPGAISAVEVRELPGVYQTILDLFPENPFTSLSTGDMMPIIIFAIIFGTAILLMEGSESEEVQRLKNLIHTISNAMFQVIDFVILVIPVGVFGLMSASMANYGTSIFGPVFKFILADYVANIIILVGVYSILLVFIGKVNPLTFWKKASQTFLVAFSTCTSSASLPISMEVAPKQMGINPEVSNFILPLGATAQMNGTCTFFAIMTMFAAQIYGIEIPISQQILLMVQATFLSVGCAATPQIGLVISLTLLTQMGLPLDAYAMVAGIYRIVDQIHTATNSSGDLVAAVCIAQMQGDVDMDVFNDPKAGREQISA